MPKQKQAKEPAAVRHPIMTFMVYLAMGIVAFALAAGLYMHSGVALVPSAILGTVLFLVVATSEFALGRARRAAAFMTRVETLEAKLEALSNEPSSRDEQAKSQAQIAQSQTLIEDIGKRLATLEQLAEEYAEQDEAGGYQTAPAYQPTLDTDQMALFDRVVIDVDRLDARLEALRSQVEIEGREWRDKITSELKMLETLVKQVAERMALDAGLEQRKAVIPAPPAESQFAPSGEVADEPPQVVVPASAGAEETAAGEESPPLFATEQFGSGMLEEVKRSIEANRIDLYLQPIVTLPQRKVRYYEALTRLRDGAGVTIMPTDYLQIAETAGMMPLIDNIMLFRSVQVLRRLGERSSAHGVFCNISVHSLVDAEFFPEFISFMEQNRALADSLYFEFGQDMIEACGPIEIESLGALHALGFHFSLDHVRDLKVDFRTLHERGFRFVKIDADMFLNRMEEAGARIHPADMRAYLERFGLELIIEKIEDERCVANVLDHNVELAQGFLFSEPRPVRPEVYDRDDGAEAA